MANSENKIDYWIKNENKQTMKMDFKSINDNRFQNGVDDGWRRTTDDDGQRGTTSRRRTTTDGIVDGGTQSSDLVNGIAWKYKS